MGGQISVFVLRAYDDFSSEAHEEAKYHDNEEFDWSRFSIRKVRGPLFICNSLHAQKKVTKKNFIIKILKAEFLSYNFRKIRVFG